MHTASPSSADPRRLGECAIASSAAAAHHVSAAWPPGDGQARAQALVDGRLQVDAPVSHPTAIERRPRVELLPDALPSWSTATRPVRVCQRRTMTST